MKFIEELTELHREIIKDWYEHSGKLIGVSIQIKDELQSENTVTRNTHTDENNNQPNSLINNYCSHILSSDGNVEKCNKLDFYLKEYLDVNSFKVNERVICHCHRNITNIVFKYHYKSYTDISWYIFIGQFLLEVPKGKYSNNFLIQNYYKADKLTKSKIGKHERLKNADSMIKEGGYVDVSDLNARNAEIPITHPENKRGLSLVSVQDIKAFEKFVKYRFDDFLSKYIEFRSSKYSETPELIEYIKHVDIPNLKFHLEECRKKDCKSKFDVENQIDSIISLIDEKSEKLTPEIKQSLKNYALSHKNSNVGTPKFFELGKTILKNLNAF